MADRDALLTQLDVAHEAFHNALDAVDAELVTVPGVVGDWSVRDIVHHLAAWSEHASGALDLAASGRGAEFSYSSADTDAMNERLVAEARTTSPTDALTREESAFGDFRQRVAELDPTLLDQRLGNGDTVREVIEYDGPEHYAEHTAHLREWFSEEGDDDAPVGG